MKSGKFLLLLLIVFQLFIACENPDGEGAFENTDEIIIQYPENGSTFSLSGDNGLNGNYFSWKNTNLKIQDTQNVVLALFTEMPVINQGKMVISNMTNCAGGIRSGLSGSFSGFSVRPDSLYVFSAEKRDFTSEAYNVSIGVQYYWLVWALDDYGNLAYSSKIYSVTFTK